MRVNVVQPEEDVFGGLHFHNGKCHWVADGEMFPIRIRKIDNISVRQTYRWKARFVRFEHVQVITGSEVISATGPYHSNVCAKFSPKGIILGGQFMSPYKPRSY